MNDDEGNDQGKDTVDLMSESAVERLTKDLAKAARTLTEKQARFLVDVYYAMQDGRKRADNMVAALVKSEEPNSVLDWFAAQNQRLEDQVRRALDQYSNASELGQWARSIVGIGPVIAAGLLAHIDIRRAPTAGAIWRYAGLDPTQHWLGRAAAKTRCDELKASGVSVEDAITTMAAEMGSKLETLTSFATEGGKSKPTWVSLAAASARCPWNARLKVLCWKIGESFVKTQNHEDGYYGHVFENRKAMEVSNNLCGVYAGRAAVDAKRVGKNTDAFEWYNGCLTAEAATQIIMADSAVREGLVKKLAGKPGSGVPMLPPGHIHARAKRYAVKLFLSHYHDKAYRLCFGRAPPLPYPLQNPALSKIHSHYIAPPA